MAVIPRKGITDERLCLLFHGVIKSVSRLDLDQYGSIYFLLLNWLCFQSSEIKMKLQAETPYDHHNVDHMVTRINISYYYGMS